MSRGKGTVFTIWALHPCPFFGPVGDYSIEQKAFQRQCGFVPQIVFSFVACTIKGINGNKRGILGIVIKVSLIRKILPDNIAHIFFGAGHEMQCGAS